MLKVKLNSFKEVIDLDDEGLELNITEPLFISDPHGHLQWPRWKYENGRAIENVIRILPVTKDINSIEIVSHYVQAQFNIERDFVNGVFTAPNGNIVHDIDFLYRGQERDEYGNPKYELINGAASLKQNAGTLRSEARRKELFDANNTITKNQIERGFSFIKNGVTYTFSLSEGAQNNLNSLMLKLLISQLTFPHALSTKDDAQVSYSIADATEFTAICMAAANAKQTAIDEGNAQKEVIKNLTAQTLFTYANPRVVG